MSDTSTRFMSDDEAESMAIFASEIIAHCGEGSIIVAGSMLGNILLALDETTAEISIVDAHGMRHTRALVSEAMRHYESLGRILVAALTSMSTARRKRFCDLLAETHPCCTTKGVPQ